jgi:hypothetical protein
LGVFFSRKEVGFLFGGCVFNAIGAGLDGVGFSFKVGSPTDVSGDKRIESVLSVGAVTSLDKGDD